jgi:hypothetical protein
MITDYFISAFLILGMLRQMAAQCIGGMARMAEMLPRISEALVSFFQGGAGLR